MNCHLSITKIVMKDDIEINYFFDVVDISTMSSTSVVIKVFSCELKSKTCFKSVSPNGFAVPRAEKKYVERLFFEFSFLIGYPIRYSNYSRSKILASARYRNEY